MMRLSLLLLVPVCLSMAQAPPVTGLEVPGMAAYDRLIPAFLQKYKAPGAAVAVMRDGRLVFARGYGYADVESRTPVQPDSLFRFASVSKSLTAIGVMKLVEEKKLSLDAKALDLLPDLRPAPGQTVTAQFRNVTVRQLLSHTGGWDREKTPGGYDPMFQNTQVTQALGVPSPAACNDIMRWMLGRPMDFNPGQKYAYSNFGYCILGRLIEKASGEPYEQYMQRKVFLPMGIGKMVIGSSRLEGRKPGEVKYYGYEGEPLAQSVFPDGPRQVPVVYGAWDLRTLDAHGGWIGSAMDLLRFIKALDPAGTGFLSRDSILQVIAKPPAPVATADAVSWYGLGFLVRTAANEGNWWHNGSLPGTTTLMVRAGANRSAWAVLINTRDREQQMAAELDATMWTAINGSTIPAHDLFDRYPSAPALAASVSALTFEPPYAPQTLNINSTGGTQDFAVSATGGAGWLRVTPAGRTPASVTVEVSPAGLAEGSYQAAIRCAASDGNPSQVTVNVTLRVTGVPVIAAIRNAASKREGPVAPGSLALLEGGNLEGAVLTAPDRTAIPLVDGAFVVPAHLAPGTTVALTASLADGRAGSREVQLENTAPGLFSGSASEDGVLTLLATGVRNQPDLSAYQLMLGETALEVLEMSPVEGQAGVDRVRVRLPPAAVGEVEVVLMVDGRASNVLKVATGRE